MSNFKRILLATAFLLPGLAHADITISQTIKSYNYDGGAEQLYVVGNSGWGSPACPNAMYVYIKSTVPGRKQIFAAVLAAQAQGKIVRFQGTCEDANYFSAHYIEVIG